MYQGASLSKNTEFEKGISRYNKTDPSKDKYQILNDYENMYVKAPAGYERYIEVFKGKLSEAKNKDRLDADVSNENIHTFNENPMYVQEEEEEVENSSGSILKTRKNSTIVPAKKFFSQNPHRNSIIERE